MPKYNKLHGGQVMGKRRIKKYASGGTTDPYGVDITDSKWTDNLSGSISFEDGLHWETTKQAQSDSAQGMWEAMTPDSKLDYVDDTYQKFQNNAKTFGSIPLVGGLLESHYTNKANEWNDQFGGFRATMAKSDAAQSYLNTQSSLSNSYAPTFAVGGKVKPKKMPMGGSVQQKLIEIEKGEPFRTPDGTIATVKNDDKLSH